MNKKILRKEIESFETTQIKENYQNLNFTIILVQPETAGNIGAIARVMKNFDFDKLLIFNPKETIENILSYEADGFAMHGKEILRNSEIITLSDQTTHSTQFSKLMKRFDLVIASTAKGTHYRNLRRLSIFPENLNLPKSIAPLEVALIFGKESRGLTNEEIELADILIRIPTSDKYPTLNLSHACNIILYEIFKKINNISLGRGKNPVILAGKEDRKILYNIIQNLIEKLKIRTHKKENVLYAFKNVFERSLISKKELSLILGVFSKVESILRNKKLYEKKK
ncbi:MAG: TrmJ/YjtD family RNA methyltransferase [Candidatus Lokiarchaeota archaeon]|nr:TrmJ/YjtD family RNA methyltransferase [Candidatus Lokiarchaeota archaeon]